MIVLALTLAAWAPVVGDRRERWRAARLVVWKEPDLL